MAIRWVIAVPPIITPIWLLHIVTAVGLAAAAWAFWRWRRLTWRSHDGTLLSLVLNNMTQGVVLVDDKERIVVCNDRYRAMYRLSPAIIKPGCTLRELIAHRISTGSLNLDPEKYRAEILEAVRQGQGMSRIVETPDGRAVSVVNRSIEGGRFWIGTHDDITDRIQAERQGAALLEQERRRVAIEAEIEAFRENAAAMLATVNESTAALKSIALALSNSSGDTSERAAGAVRDLERGLGQHDRGGRRRRRADRLDRRDRPADQPGGRAGHPFGGGGAATDDQMAASTTRCRKSARSSA